MVRRLAVLTTGRADWNILAPVAAAAHADPAFDVGVIVAAGHLDEDQGLTVREVEAAPAPVVARLPWGEGPAAVRAARVMRGMAEAMEAARPDLLLLLGDRFEVLAAAQAAVLAGVPIAHLSGGDMSLGALDDGFRHALTKLSHLHLVFHEEAARRVRGLGEGADRVHRVGNPALDVLPALAALPTEALEARLEAPLGARNLLVTFHPVTTASDHGLGELEALLAALDRLDPDWTLWLTAPNADPGGEAMTGRIRAWSEGRPNRRFRAALGSAYPALAARCAAVVGNSSSGLAEVPTLGVPTVDVGDRQAGRLAGPGVVHAAAEPDAILRALDRALSLPARERTNPYGDGRSVPRVLDVLRAAPPAAVLLRKPFVDREPADV